MSMSTNEHPSAGPPNRSTPTKGAKNAPDRFELLSERQLLYLRLVQQHYNSKEIGKMHGVGHRAVDKQLDKAKEILGAKGRFDAARRLADLESGVETPYPANSLPSAQPTFPLPSPLPTAVAAANMLSWKQVALWSAIIAIVAPVGLTAAGMVIVTLGLLLGIKVL